MSYPRLPIKLVDCESEGPEFETELFVVEGDSAAQAVARIREPLFQAVLPMQGKPMNAMKAREKTVRENPFFMALIDAIGTNIGDSIEIASCRYNRILLLFDPDADGIHCGTLMLMFFYRWLRPLLESGQVAIVRPPMMEIVADRLQEPVLAYSEEEGQKICNEMKQQGRTNTIKKRFRGLASLSADVLSQCCVAPSTRNAFRLTVRDAERSIELLAAFNADS